MTKTVNYRRNRSADLAYFTTLILGFLTWDLLTIHFGFLVLAFGMNYTFISSERNQRRVDSFIDRTESRVDFITQKQEWKQLRPILYLGLTIVLSALAYAVTIH